MSRAIFAWDNFNTDPGPSAAVTLAEEDAAADWLEAAVVVAVVDQNFVVPVKLRRV